MNGRSMIEQPFRRVRIEENGCWTWLGFVGKNGYPRVHLTRAEGSRTVHRLIAELLNGLPIEVVHHKCENKLCVNPMHWEVVDDQATHARLHNKERGCRQHGNADYYRTPGTSNGYCRICRRERRAAGRD
jgi:hypothetical protein